MKDKIYQILLIALLAVTPVIISAQPGTIDTTFNSIDVGFGNGDGANWNVWSTSILPDGKIIIGGDFTSYNSTSRNYIARLNSDGSLDANFLMGTGAGSYVYTTALQPDGKILIGGDFTSYNGTARNRIARLNADGSLDASFNVGTGANSSVLTTVIQPDGKIIILGGFTSYNGTPRNRIARLNEDGSLDASFNVGTGANNSVSTISIQPDGKIIIGGWVTTYNGTPINHIARLNADGSLDASFSVETGANSAVLTSSIQPDGKIIIGGVFTVFNGTTKIRMARLNEDGSLDSSFNVGTGANNSVRTMAIQSDGKIIIGGTFTSYNGTSINRIARLNADGSLDAGFDVGTGTNTNGTILTTAIQPDGKIILGGEFITFNETPRNYITRLNVDGSLDAGFNVETGASNEVRTIAIQPDGKIIIGGWFTSFNGTAINRIARLNADGSLDTSFNVGMGANAPVRTIAIQPDGKIIIGGSFSTYNGTLRYRIARLNPDGSLDASFNMGTQVSSNEVLTTAIQPDGKIIIGGSFTSYNGTPVNRIARLNENGSLDTGFNVGTGTNNSVFTCAIQSDGKIIIGGFFTTYNGTSINRLARLNADGSLDTSFNLGTGANSTVLTTAIQPDSKIIIGGNFTNYNGTSKNYLARLNPDGSLDASFNPGTGAVSLRIAAIQPDGKIIIGGLFTSYNGTAINRIARLNSDGSLDTNFNVGMGANNSVQTTAIQPDGKIIIGGEFTSYNGTGRNRIARINGGDCLSANGIDEVSACGNYIWIDGNIYSENNNTATFNIVGGAANGCDSLVTLNLTILQSATGIDEVSVCETYIWIDGNTYTESNNTATFNIVGSAENGCDSLVTLNLTITGNNLTYTTTSTQATLGFANGSATVQVSGGQEPYSYYWNDPFMQTNATAVGLFPGSYNCTVSDAAQCDVNIIVFVGLFTGVPETQVHNSHCNTGGFELGSLVSAYTVQNADAYRWEFTEQGGGTLPEYTRYQTNPHILMHWISGVALSKTYEVRVKARVNGNWGNYGNVCAITTVSDVPLTGVRPPYTPTNVQGYPYAMCNLATAFTVNGSENYEWEFDNGIDPAVYYVRGAGNPSVKLSWVECLKPNYTYLTRVRAQVDGQWGTFGNAHPLEMAPTANTALRANICGTTRALTQFLLPNPVCIADSYTYELVNTVTSDVHTATSTNAAGSVLLNTVSPALVPGATYSVRVKATQCGEEGDFSAACNITIAGPQAQGDETPALRTMAENSATLYPNPNAGTEVRVELNGLGDGNHEVMIQIYDIYGKLIQTEGFGHAGSAMSRLVRFDGNMAMGMYMVQIVVDGERFATERLVIK